VDRFTLSFYSVSSVEVDCHLHLAQNRRRTRSISSVGPMPSSTSTACIKNPWTVSRGAAPQRDSTAADDFLWRRFGGLLERLLRIDKRLCASLPPLPHIISPPTRPLSSPLGHVMWTVFRAGSRLSWRADLGLEQTGGYITLSKCRTDGVRRKGSRPAAARKAHFEVRAPDEQ
jgi:hypothetical protein